MVKGIHDFAIKYVYMTMTRTLYIGKVKFRIRVSKYQFSFSINSFNFNANPKILFEMSVTNFVTLNYYSIIFDPNKEFR